MRLKAAQWGQILFNSISFEFVTAIIQGFLSNVFGSWVNFIQSTEVIYLQSKAEKSTNFQAALKLKQHCHILLLQEAGWYQKE